MSLTTETDVSQHISAGRFAEAESAIRELIAHTDPHDSKKLLHLFGLQGSILNSLGRHDDATSALREALNQALRSGHATFEASFQRYLLANQHVNFGTPAQALTVVGRVPPGVGHVQCLLHTTVARALWALSRPEEARKVAADALAAAPTDERRSEAAPNLAQYLRRPKNEVKPRGA